MLGNCIGILPTGQNFYSKAKESHIYHVPYSLHSSYTELKEFIQKVSATNVFPLVVNSEFYNLVPHDPQTERSERLRRSQEILDSAEKNTRPVQIDTTRKSSYENNPK